MKLTTLDGTVPVDGRRRYWLALRAALVGVAVLAVCGSLHPSAHAASPAYPPTCSPGEVGHYPQECLTNEGTDLSLTVSPKEATVGQSVTITWSSSVGWCQVVTKGPCIDTGAFTGNPVRYIPDGGVDYHAPGVQLPPTCVLPTKSKVGWSLSCSGPVVGGSGPQAAGQVLTNRWVVLQSNMYVSADGGNPPTVDNVVEAAFLLIGPGPVVDSVEATPKVQADGSVPVVGGSLVEILGHGFSGTSIVVHFTGIFNGTTFDLTEDTPDVVSADQIDATVPDFTTVFSGLGLPTTSQPRLRADVQVEIRDSGSNNGESPPYPSQDALEIDGPAIETATPSSGPLSGAKVHIHGSGFTGAQFVRWTATLPGGATLSTRVAPDNVSDSDLDVTLPDMTQPIAEAGSSPVGEFQVEVKNSAVLLSALKGTIIDGFQFGGPIVQAVTPVPADAGGGVPVVGGTLVVIDGSGFASSALVVHFQGTENGLPFDLADRAPHLVSDSQIDARVPDFTGTFKALSLPTPDVADVTVDVRVEVASSPTSLISVESPVDPAHDQLTVQAPIITSIEPAQGPLAGQTIKILGSGLTGTQHVVFTPQAGQPVTFGFSIATDVTVVDDGEVDVIVPDATNFWHKGQFAVDTGEIQVQVENGGKVLSATHGLASDGYAIQGFRPYVCSALIHCTDSVNNGPGGSVSATSGSPNSGVTVTAQGGGGVTVGQYASNPVGTPSFAVGGSYFDVQASTPNSFTSLTIQDCGNPGGGAAEWWDPTANGGSGAWLPVSNAVYAAGPPPCLTITVDASTSPTLAQLTGTVFALESGGSSPATATLPGSIPAIVLAIPIAEATPPAAATPVSTPDATPATTPPTTPTPSIPESPTAEVTPRQSTPIANTPQPGTTQGSAVLDATPAPSTPVAPSTGSGTTAHDPADLRFSAVALLLVVLAALLAAIQLRRRRR